MRFTRTFKPENCHPYQLQHRIVKMESLVCLIGISIGAIMVHANRMDDMIDIVNNANIGWKAGYNFLPGTSEEYIRGLCGTRRDKVLSLPVKTYSGKTAIPDEFDARKQWPNCPTISHIQDQGNCGSCWAFGTTGSFSDRLCIANNGSFTLPLSTDDITACSQFGCDGGNLPQAWGFFAEPGVVTGGDYHSKVGCRTYELEPCEHQGTKGPLPPCKDPMAPTPPCKGQCNNPSYKIPYSKDKHKADESTIATYSEIKAMQEGIMNHGPISASFDVYNDFVHYKSGVYQVHPNATLLGGHCVRVIGWGTEEGTPYWLVANSWNSDWGDKGLFKIRRGTDEVGIEDGMVAGLPLLK